jgi:lipid-A-disaccharide synthase-like uncharacterized protein
LSEPFLPTIASNALRPASRILSLTVLVTFALTTTAIAQDGDPREVGLSWPWLVFGFSAQAVFAARFLVQWISSERKGESVVPTSFWILSLIGGIALFVYFARRGDPVGMAGQAFGGAIYLRNLYFISKKKRATP